MINHNCVHHAIILVQFLFFATMSSAAGQSAPPPRPYGWNSEFNPSMAIFIVALISAFFFLGFFLIYLRQCVDNGRNGRGGSVRPANVDGGRSRRGKRGLDRDIIETFPIINYSDVKGLKIGKGALECAVCLNEFEDDETLRLLPKCDHVFHPECIDAWLVAHVTCPVCRSNLKPESVDVDDGVAAAREASETDIETNEALENGDARNQVAATTTTEHQDPQGDVINTNQIPIQYRSVGFGPRITGRFPRSHSTGHSLIQPGENCERFTLRLPDDVRKRIVNGRLNRTTSCLAFPTGDGSVSGGSNRGEGSSRGRSIRLGRVDRNVKSDRWIFSMAPPFFTRTCSVKSQKVTDGDCSFGGSSSSSSVFPRGLRNSVKSPSPLDCLGAKGEGSSTEISNGRPPV